MNVITFRRCVTAFGLALAINITVSLASVADTVPNWGRYVVTLPNPSYSGNPFELEVDATFTHSMSGTQLVLPGYYSGNDVWKVGFMPTLVGDWTFTTSSLDADLDAVTGLVTAVESGRRGLLKSASSAARKWKFADGPYVVPIALRFDVFHEDGTLARFTEVADFLRNEVNAHMVEFTFRNEVFSNAQNHEFNLPLWDRLEDRLNALSERGLGIHFMIYSDSGQQPTWSAQSDTEQLLIRYLVARLAAYPVVIYNSGIDIAEYRNGAWIDWYGQQIRALDPYQHPVSSRYGGGSGNHVMSGQTFDSRGDRTALIDDLIDHFDSATVPVSMDDAWSENSPFSAARDKDFTEHDIRRAIWKCVVAGGLGAILRGSVQFNQDRWFRMADVEEDLESEQWLVLINSFIQTELGPQFGSMTPVQALATNGYALATPNLSKIVTLLVGQNDRYDPGNGGSVTLHLGNASGQYSVYWFDPRTGLKTNIAAVDAGLDHVFQPPTSDDWVLMLSSENAVPAPPTSLEAN